MARIPTNRIPTHPGEILREEFLEPLNMTQRNLAGIINTSYQRVNELVNGKRGITPDTALRLSKAFGNSAEFWMNLQSQRDIYLAYQKEKDVLESIQPISLEKHEMLPV